MKKKLVISGYFKWLIPLVIIILTISVTLYIILPVYENFENKSNIDPKELDDIGNKLSNIQDIISKYQNKQDKQDKQDNKNNKEDNEKDEKDTRENQPEKKLDPKDTLENLTKMLSVLKKGDKKEKEDKKEVKENFISYRNTSLETLKKNWNKENIPSPLEVYKGSIKGYNCGEYADYSLNYPESCLNSKAEYVLPPSHNKDHLFNPREHHHSNQIKYASQPYILHHEDDISQKILEYESTNVFNNHKYGNVDVDRPKIKKTI